MYDPDGYIGIKHNWLGGVYYTDASGGQFTSVPQLRLVGCSVVTVEGINIETGVSFMLPGIIQTVVRGELFAIWHVLNNVAASSVVTICSDSLVNVDLFNGSRNNAINSTNGDIFYFAFQQIDQKGLKVRIKWIKAHLDKDKTGQYDKYNFTDSEFAGNYFADAFADAAALHVQVDRHNAVKVLYNIKLCRLIQQRLTALLCSGKFKKDLLDKKIKPPKAKQPTFDELITTTRHVLISDVDECRYTCLVCAGRIHRNAPDAIKWLNSYCGSEAFDDRSGPVPVPPDHTIRVANQLVHSSHNMFSCEGIVFCISCGCYSSVKIRNLNKVCEQHCTSTSQKVIDCLYKCQLPDGVSRWPVPDQHYKHRSANYKSRHPEFNTVSQDFISELASEEKSAINDILYQLDEFQTAETEEGKSSPVVFST